MAKKQDVARKAGSAKAAALLKRAGVAGSGDEGLLMVEADDKNAQPAFLSALAKHRHYQRELDPPRV
jgi:catalase